MGQGERDTDTGPSGAVTELYIWARRFTPTQRSKLSGAGIPSFLLLCLLCVKVVGGFQFMALLVLKKDKNRRKKKVKVTQRQIGES